MVRGIAVKTNPYIENVFVYSGHLKNPLFGPYYSCIGKRIEMFKSLNAYRAEIKRPAWKITSVSGENLIEVLQQNNPYRTLLVIPAGPSTKLQAVFSSSQCEYLKEKFFPEGGLGYFNCGSAYWVSKERLYRDLSKETNVSSLVVKISNLPLFAGKAIGPLCPYPGKKHYEGYFSDAVTVTDGQQTCSICLSGGGSFVPDSTEQKVKVLVKYLSTELRRHAKTMKDCPVGENAAIMVSIREGAALLSSFHPYYGAEDIDVENYTREFPDSGTDWQSVKEKLSSFDDRMRFALNSMLCPLEDRAFDSSL